MLQTYKDQTDILQSRLFKWAGDAYGFDKDEAYVELVTSPNNPDGLLRQPVLNKAGGMVIYDLAYYWPQYTAITSSLDHPIMIFTLSKCSGHAGSRIGYFSKNVFGNLFIILKTKLTLLNSFLFN